MPPDNQLLFSDYCSVYTGTVPDTTTHAHGAVALIISLGRDFEVQASSGESAFCRSVLIDAGARHALLTRQEPVLTCYLENHSPVTQQLRHTCFRKDRIVTDVVDGQLPWQRVQQGLMNRDIQDLMRIGRATGESGPDPRIMRCLSLFSEPPPAPRNSVARVSSPAPVSIEHMAALEGILESRMRHLFKEQTGISLRSYRLWRQILMFMRTFSESSSITHHALDTGFFDSSHFSNTYRKLLGLSPVSILKNLNTPVD